MKSKGRHSVKKAVDLLRKLTESTVREARESHATTGETFASLAIRLGVSHSAIAHAVNRRTWRHV